MKFPKIRPSQIFFFDMEQELEYHAPMLLHKRAHEDNHFSPSKRFASQRCVDDLKSLRSAPTSFDFRGTAQKRTRDCEMEMEMEEEPPRKRLNGYVEEDTVSNQWNLGVEFGAPLVDHSPFQNTQYALPQPIENEIIVLQPNLSNQLQTYPSQENLVVSPSVLRWIESQPPSRWLQPTDYREAQGAIVLYQDPRETIGNSLRGYESCKMVLED